MSTKSAAPADDSPPPSPGPKVVKQPKKKNKGTVEHAFGMRDFLKDRAAQNDKQRKEILSKAEHLSTKVDNNLTEAAKWEIYGNKLKEKEEAGEGSIEVKKEEPDEGSIVVKKEESSEG
ncbi:hypothetical protein ACHAPJ_011681 [Fusarium lateritium]